MPWNRKPYVERAATPRDELFSVPRLLCAILLSCEAFLAGCGGSSTSTPSPASTTPTASSTIKQIVIIMQENRTLDNLFMGFPGADTVTSGMRDGAVVSLQPVPFEQGTDVDHSHEGWFLDYDNGKMDGFSHAPSYPVPDLPYAYVPQSETLPLWTLAKAYTLGDRMFQSNTGPSFVAHQYLIAGQSSEADNNPSAPNAWGCDSKTGTTVTLIGPNGTSLPGPYPCFDYQTMADLLNAKGIIWRYYAAAEGTGSLVKGGGYIWSAYDAIRHIRFGSDWSTNVISPPPQVLTDIQNGNLAQVTWITPSADYSDHAGPHLTAEGPDWVASIANAIGASQYWDSSVIFITWDDWGGWYDHVPSPMIDNMGLGFRVPLIIVSPYANHGYISHTVHEFSGFLTYTEEVFNLPSLGTRDVNADDFHDCFNYSRTPQPYVQIPVTFTASFFRSLTATSAPDDD